MEAHRAPLCALEAFLMALADAVEALVARTSPRQVLGGRESDSSVMAIL